MGHWGPQSAPEQGDWYARRMYDEGSPVYKWHVEHFGHPSKVGYKDVIPTFKGEKFDPENLLGLYKRAGAKYFMSMGVHHDNFNMWNSPTIAGTPWPWPEKRCRRPIPEGGCQTRAAIWSQ